MKYTLSVILGIAFISAFGQNSRFGTTIIFATGTDGIIMAADSRATVYSDTLQQHLLYYIDSVEKIYLINGYPLGVTGSYDFGNKFIADIIKNFNAIQQVKNFDCLNTFEAFISYMDYFYPVNKYPFSKINGYFCIGYMGDSAYLIGKYNQNEKMMSAWDSCGSNGAGADSIFKKKYKRITCSKLAKLAEESIIEYYTKLKKNKTGGAISIVKITKDNKAVFLKNDFSPNPQGEKTRHYVP